MTTYQDLEKQKSEHDIEFESLIFQMDEMIEQVEEMQKSLCLGIARISEEGIQRRGEVFHTISHRH
jgi:hypothetical protein